MDSFIPIEKRSKKARRQAHQSQRSGWHGVNPVTRRIASKKVYNRKKSRPGSRNEGNMTGAFDFHAFINLQSAVAV